MKTDQESDQGKAAMVSALEQVAELGCELSRPGYSEVDNAIGQYLLETVQPVMPRRTREQDAPKRLSLRLLLARLFGGRRDVTDGQSTAVTQFQSEPARTAPLDCTLIESVEEAADALYEVEERESQVGVH